MNLETSSVVDIIVLAFFILNIIAGMVRGGFKSIIGIVVMGASVFLGYKLSPSLTPRTVDWLYPKFSDKLAGIAAEKLGMSAELVPEEAMESVVKPMMTKPVRIILWILIALAAFLVLSLAARLLNGLIKKTPIIKGMNRSLGGLISLLLSAIVCTGICLGIGAMGLTDYVGEKLGNPVSYKIFSSFVPKSIKDDNYKVNVPGIGEIDLGELLKLIKSDDKRSYGN